MTTSPNTDAIHALLTAAKTEIALHFLEWSESLTQCCDNPSILKRSGKRFTMLSSSLSTSWDPFFHDWTRQYECVQGYLENALTHASARSALSSLAKNGKTYDTHGTHTYHPEVLKHVQPLVQAVSNTMRLWHLDQVEPNTNLML